MEIKEVELDKVVLDAKNARKHDDKNIRMIAASLLEFGQQRLPVINHKNIVIAGNGTVMAARTINLKSLQFIVSDLNDTKALAYSIADNQIASTSTWDLETFGLNLKEIKNENWLKDWNAIGFERDELNAFLNVDWGTDSAKDKNFDESTEEKKPEKAKPIKVNNEQREIFELALDKMRTDTGDTSLTESRCVELLSAEYLAGV